EAAIGGDEEVEPAAGASLEDDGVVAVLLQVRAEKAIGLCGTQQVRHRPLCYGRIGACTMHLCARERTCSDDQSILRVVPLDAGWHLVVQDLRAEASAAQPHPRLGSCDGFVR